MDRIAKPPDRSLSNCVTIDDVRAAAGRLDGVAVRTPTVRAPLLEERTGARRVWLKCENLQHINAFKFRGAYNALSQIDAGTGVLAYSSGNHAQAIAKAAAMLGRLAVVVMPSDAPSVKLARTKALLLQAADGSRVVEYDPQTTKREELGAQIAEAQGLEVVPPYDDVRVIAGQGTVALEMFEDAARDGNGPIDLLMVCCGGGGLLSGCAVLAKSLSPDTRVVGVEPALADDAARSFRSGVLHAVENPQTIADGARTPYLGRFTFPLVMEHVDDIITASEDEIVSATKLATRELKLVVEPTGALALAGLLGMGEAARGLRVGVVLTGGNIDPAALAEMLG